MNQDLCKRCTRETHFANPYHRVGWWNGRFHQKGWLRDTGVAIFLCDKADPFTGTQCPGYSSQASLPPGFDDCDPDGYLSGDAQPYNPYIDDAETSVDAAHDDVHCTRADGSDEGDDLLSMLAAVTLDEADVESSSTQCADESDDSGPHRRTEEQLDNEGSTRGKYPAVDPRGLTVMAVGDVTHMHGIGVQFCRCPSAAPRDEQLLEYGIYPASSERPATGFTLHMLDYLHVDEVECKTSPDAYFRKIRRLTDSHDWRTVPVR